MRTLPTLMVLLIGCGARTPLAGDAPTDVGDAAVAIDRPAAVDLGTEVGVDAPSIDVVVSIDRPVLPPADRPAFCGDGVLSAGEECDLGADNGPTDAFTLSQPGRPAVVVRPLARRLPVTDFYRYESASAHTGFEDAGLVNHILYVDSTTGTLSLVFVAGRDGELGLLPQQPDATLQIDWSGVPTAAAVAVSDDGGELRGVGVGRFEGRWSFQDNTDGGVISGIPWNQSWRITAQTIRADGMTRARFVGLAGATNTLGLRDDVTLTHRIGNLCREDCRRPRCGDGRLDASERCDDGNTASGDGCSTDCQRFD